MTVIPCGREDGQNEDEDMPYEIKIRKKCNLDCPLNVYHILENENSLKDIFTRKPQLWEKIFKCHLVHDTAPNFSVYRKPFEFDQDSTKSDLCKSSTLLTPQTSTYYT
jgi:hypothetical protein